MFYPACVARGSFLIKEREKKDEKKERVTSAVTAYSI
jgi:hypothetical protein